MLCCRAQGGYCDRCDLLVGLPGLHVVAVERDARDRLRVPVESPPTPMGCPTCGSSRTARPRRGPSGRCAGDGPPGHDPVAQAALAVPGPGWPGRHVRRTGQADRRTLSDADRPGVPVAIQQIRRDTRSVNGFRRQPGTGCRTVWESIRPLLAAADADSLGSRTSPSWA